MESGLVDALTERENVPFWSEDDKAWIVKWTDDWVVMVLPMIFNDRIVLCRRESYKFSWEVGWCYDKGYLAMGVAVVWDPDTEDMPPRFKKQIGKRDRRIV